MKTDKKIGLALSGGGGRGSYEMGALKYLYENKIYPGVIAGTSVGAINAAALASGFTIEKLEEFWLNIRQNSIFRYSLWKTLSGFFRKSHTPVLDTTPLKKLLTREIDIEKIRTSAIKVFIPAVNIRTGELEIFSNDTITVQHIMASAAIPMAFPHITIGRKNHYWDGGLGMNTPITPLIEAGVKKIYAVLLAPRGGDNNPLPRNRAEAFQRVLDLVLMGSFETVLTSMNPEKINEFQYRLQSENKPIVMHIIQPRKNLGVQSFLNFSREQAETFLQLGYNDARHSLTIR